MDRIFDQRTTQSMRRTVTAGEDTECRWQYRNDKVEARPVLYLEQGHAPGHASIPAAADQWRQR